MLLAGILPALYGRGAAADSADAIYSTRSAIANAAAVVEGRVTKVAYTYDPIAGPRTVATLSDVTTHFGRFGDRTLTVATLGGPISERRWLFIPELPRLTEDARYLIFLTNVDWFFTPVVGEYIFRLEPDPQGRDVLIDPSGHAVTGVNAAGLQVATDPVVDARLEFSTPNTKQRLLASGRPGLARAMSKDEFLAAVQDLLRATPLSGEYQRLPTAGRVWNRGVAVAAPADDAAPHPEPADDLVCVDPGPRAAVCRDSSDR